MELVSPSELRIAGRYLFAESIQFGHRFQQDRAGYSVRKIRPHPSKGADTCPEGERKDDYDTSHLPADETQGLTDGDNSADDLGPVRVEHFAARLVGALISMGTKEVALGLEQIGWKHGATVAIVVTQ